MALFTQTMHPIPGYLAPRSAGVICIKGTFGRIGDKQYKYKAAGLYKQTRARLNAKNSKGPLEG